LPMSTKDVHPEKFHEPCTVGIVFPFDESRSKGHKLIVRVKGYGYKQNASYLASQKCSVNRKNWLVATVRVYAWSECPESPPKYGESPVPPLRGLLRVSLWVTLHIIHHSWIACFHRLKLFREHSV
jgi:hypothetical protein